MAGKSAVGETELVDRIDDVHHAARGWGPEARGSKKQDDRLVLVNPCVVRHNFYACTLLGLPASESLNRSLKHVVSFTEPNLVPVMSEPGRE
jgi:hypothetical protein